MPPVIITNGLDEFPEVEAQLKAVGITGGAQASDDVWSVQSQNGSLVIVTPTGLSQSVDFTSGKSRHRSKEPGHGAAPLKKALGISQFQKRHGRLPHIVDATGGWGQDAWIVASLGCDIELIEKHPVVHALLASGIQLALADVDAASVASRITLSHEDATRCLPDYNTDVVYLDPMYPHRERKKADSKKGMQILQALLGPADEDLSEQLLAAALESLATRIVVKRPKGSETLAPPETFKGQIITIQSPNTRYDVYLRP